MKILTYILASILFMPALMGQVKDPVKWLFTSRKLNDTTFEIKFSAKIDNRWHIYSQSTPDGGPVPTSFTFARNPLVRTEGPVKELGKMEKHFEKLFGVEVKQYSREVDFVQLVRVRRKAKTTIAGTVRFMSCNDSECLPPKELEFSLPIR